MTPEEYAQKFKSASPVSQEEVAGLPGDPGWKPTITVVNSTEDEMYQQEMAILAAGGADYGGREQLIEAMQRLGR